MDDSELRGRIITLEALVYGLLELRAIEVGNAGGENAVTNLATHLGEIVGQRIHGLPEEQATFVKGCFGDYLQVLEDRLRPKARGVTVN